MSNTKTRDLVLIAQFTALMVVLSQIIIPLPFTPIFVSLGTLGVFLAGGLLGPARGAVTMVVYLLLGGFGLPVFQGFRGGPGVLIGPTGGYIVGYIAAAWLIGLCLGGARAKEQGFWTRATAMTLGLTACYALGTAWFMFLTGRGLVESLALCVFPFLIGDALKIVAASLLCQRLRRFVR